LPRGYPSAINLVTESIKVYFTARKYKTQSDVAFDVPMERNMVLGVPGIDIETIDQSKYAGDQLAGWLIINGDGDTLSLFLGQSDNFSCANQHASL
jgi:hypothetical protein